jgi:hypothetical protein
VEAVVSVLVAGGGVVGRTGAVITGVIVVEGVVVVVVAAERSGLVRDVVALRGGVLTATCARGVGVGDGPGTGVIKVREGVVTVAAVLFGCAAAAAVCCALLFCRLARTLFRVPVARAVSVPVTVAGEVPVI